MSPEAAPDAHQVEPRRFFDRGHHLVETVIIDRSPEELYRVWRRLENLACFVPRLRDVREDSAVRSHWVLAGPGGLRLHWDAEIIHDIPGEVLAWASLEGGDVDNAGSVRFQPDASGRGTLVQVTIEYVPPRGPLGRTVAGLFGADPAGVVREALGRFRAVMENGRTDHHGPPTDGRPHDPRKTRRSPMSDLQETLNAWLRDAHAMEVAAVQALETQARHFDELPEARRRIQEHAEEGRRHADIVKHCLRRRGESTSALKQATGTVGAWMSGLVNSMSEDDIVKDALAMAASEALEIASYRALIQTAEIAGDRDTARACYEILQDEIRMAQWLDHQLPLVVDTYLTAGVRSR